MEVLIKQNDYGDYKLADDEESCWIEVDSFVVYIKSGKWKDGRLVVEVHKREPGGDLEPAASLSMLDRR